MSDAAQTLSRSRGQDPSRAQPPAQAAPIRRELIYVADPMCSWCWGFAPVIKSIARQIALATGGPGGPGGDKAAMTPIMGGLRPLTRKPMTDDDKANIRHHWEEVEKRSGQPFDLAFFERDGFVYDTEPACRAVCVLRRFETQKTFDYFERVQRAFYAENAVVTDPDILAALAHEVAGIDAAGFRSAFFDISSAYETAGDFHAARQLGVSGYPTIILRTGDAFALLTQGFQAYDALKQPIADWLAGNLQTRETPA